MTERKWTKAQRACIDTRGGTVLVSAAAGSGKTSVLVERVIGLITGDTPVDIDRLLVVTFTKAAAAEMRMRLSDTLSALVSEAPEDTWLQRQQMLLARASICTVDSFCAELIRANFQSLGLPPNFRVAEPSDTAALEEDALNEAVEELYVRADPNFLRLADYLGDKRGDDGLFAGIRSVSGFIGSHARPLDWLAEKKALFDSETVAESLWGGIILENISRTLSACADMMSRAAAIAAEDPVMAEKYYPIFISERDSILAAKHSVTPAPGDNKMMLSWDGISAVLAAIPFDRLPALRNYEDEQRKLAVRKIRDDAKKAVRALPAMLCGSEEECAEDISFLSGMAKALFDAVKRFGEIFSEKKLARGMVDFVDLEHYALDLLIAPDGSRTALAEEIAEGFTEVLVDEYQDTNEVQDTIFRALSQDNNQFMVGDVKQSIYGFRQAMPEIFIRRRNAYAPYDGDSYPATITLGDNFRSRAQVTDAVNFVFRQIMRREIGGVDYNEREWLTASADFPEETGRDTELIVIDGGTRSPLEQKDAAEARVIAGKISEMMKGFQVYEKGEPRPIEYSDFCILLRSGAAHGRAYAEELKRCGIPVRTTSQGGFFRSPEIGWALAFLRVIDNPVQDVPLLAAMLSPVGGFSPDDLAVIRKDDKKAPLFTVMTKFARTASEDNAALAHRVSVFLELLSSLSVLAATLPADRLINRMLEATGMTASVMAMKHGDRRVANLRMLHSRAAAFEQRGFRGLSAFVRMLDRAQSRGEDFAAASTDYGDAVKIMTIHGSKGLEFPVVFLAGLGAQFNDNYKRSRLLCHADTGIGMKRRDTERLVEWTTLPFEAVKLSIRDTNLAEELRVLYVAMTRAKEKLVMLITEASPAGTFQRLAALSSEDGRFPPYAILEARGLGDWILAAALRHPSSAPLRAYADMEILCSGGEALPWDMRVISSPPPFSTGADEEAPSPADPGLAAEITARISWEYPYTAVSAVPAKLAASSLSHNSEISRKNAAASRPRFLTGMGILTPAERGTALHMFMQFCGYTEAAESAEAEISRLEENGFLTNRQADSINRSHIKRFFSGELYSRIRGADRVWRELNFTVDIPASRISDAELPEEESVIIQGIADCVIEENGGLTVIDYKTDRVKSVAELEERYRIQMEIYAYALARVLGMPVRECILYSFHLGEAAYLLPRT